MTNRQQRRQAGLNRLPLTTATVSLHLREDTRLPKRPPRVGFTAMGQDDMQMLLDLYGQAVRKMGYEGIMTHAAILGDLVNRLPDPCRRLIVNMVIGGLGFGIETHLDQDAETGEEVVTHVPSTVVGVYSSLVTEEQKVGAKADRAGLWVPGQP